jgi:hypothetical protein
MRSGVAVRLADRRLPQPGEDFELLLEPVEALPQRGEGNAVGGVLRLEPSAAQAEFDPSAAHLIDAGDGDGQRTGETERGRGDQGAEPDPACVAGQAGQDDPRVGRPRQPGGRVGGPVGAHVEPVVGPEEGVEAECFGLLGHGGQVVVGGALLGFGEDAKVHRIMKAPGA